MHGHLGGGLGRRGRRVAPRPRRQGPRPQGQIGYSYIILYYIIYIINIINT